MLLSVACSKENKNEHHVVKFINDLQQHFDQNKLKAHHSISLPDNFA